MSETRILIRLLRMYFPRNWEFGLALSKLRNLGGGGVEPPNTPLGTPLSYILLISHEVLMLQERSKICEGRWGNVMPMMYRNKRRNTLLCWLWMPPVLFCNELVNVWAHCIAHSSSSSVFIGYSELFKWANRTKQTYRIISCGSVRPPTNYQHLFDPLHAV
jgi:hypothetical protein